MDFSDFDNDRILWEKGTRLIRRDCQYFLSQVDHPFSLYRGMFGSTQKFIKKAVRLDSRRPQEMDVQHHDTINNYFTEAFGEPFRNALFATGDSDASNYFGSNYFIFPIGKFTFLWSWEIDDLNFHMHDLLDELFKNRNSPIPPTPEQKAEGLVKALRNVDYETDDFQKAVKSGNEIMIRCKEYYAMPADLIDKTGMITPLWDILDEVP